MIAGLQSPVVEIEALGSRRSFQDRLVLRQHVERDDVGLSIVVEVGGVDTHREPAGVTSCFGDRLGESAVAVIDVEVVVALEIVGDVEIGAAVAVEVAGDDAEPVTVDAVVQAGGVGHIGEVIPVVAEQPVAGARPAIPGLRALFDAALGMRGVVEQVHVEVAVTIVIEEQRLGGVTDVLEAVLFGAIGERSVAVVDVEHVSSVLAAVVDAGDVDVDLAVAVDVGHGDAGLPSNCISDAGFVGDVLERVAALVSIELVGAKVGGEVQIGEAIAVDITDGDAGAVVVVEVVEDVEVRFFRQRIGEGDAGLVGWQQVEQLGLGGLCASLATEQRER